MINKIGIYLIEDDFMYREQLENYIHSLKFISKEYYSLHVFPIVDPNSFYTTLNDLSIHDNDIFIIDIDLQTHFSGIDIAKVIRKKNKQSFLIFLTNREDKGIEVINQNVHALSYIVKGMDLDKNSFESALQIIGNEVKNRTQSLEEYITFKTMGEVVFLKYNEILFIKTVPKMRNTLLVKTTNSQLFVAGTINNLKKSIDSTFLYTELKSYIINLARITSLDRSSGFITFNDGSELELSPRSVGKLISAM